MAWQEVFQQIESEEFAASLNIASSRSVFLDFLSDNSAIRSLVELLRKDSENADRVLARIKLLIGLQIDYRYENPHDSALAAYAWALANEAPDLAPLAAEMLTNARQIWWAREVATLILERVPVSTAVTQTAHHSTTPPEFQSETPRVRSDSVDVSQHQLIISFLLSQSDFKVLRQPYTTRPGFQDKTLRIRPHSVSQHQLVAGFFLTQLDFKALRPPSTRIIQERHVKDSILDVNWRH